MDIQPETYRELSQNPYIVAAKEANGNISSIVRTAALCGDSLTCIPGTTTRWSRCWLGGKGVISVMSNILPKETDQICERWFAGDTAGSLSMQLQLSDMAKALFSDVNPIPIKEAMNLMGMDVGECRLPLIGMSDAGREALAAVLKKHGLIA